MTAVYDAVAFDKLMILYCVAIVYEAPLYETSF